VAQNKGNGWGEGKLRLQGTVLRDSENVTLGFVGSNSNKGKTRDKSTMALTLKTREVVRGACVGGSQRKP